MGADLIIVGHWQDGQELPMEPLRDVSPNQEPHLALAVIKDLETRYPGAWIKAIVTAP